MICIVNIEKFSKKEWKSFVKNLIDSENREFLVEQSKKYKKIDHLSMAVEDYKIKDYFFHFNLAKARIKFKERSNCMSTCKTHYTSDRRNIDTMFLCPQEKCDKIDSLSHWRMCRSYLHLRKNRNLDDDHDLMSYYQDVIKLRLNKAEKQQ